jgi:hypothetical protein
MDRANKGWFYIGAVVKTDQKMPSRSRNYPEIQIVKIWIFSVFNSPIFYAEAQAMPRLGMQPFLFMLYSAVLRGSSC